MIHCSFLLSLPAFHRPLAAVRTRAVGTPVAGVAAAINCTTAVGPLITAAVLVIRPVVLVVGPVVITAVAVVAIQANHFIARPVITMSAGAVMMVVSVAPVVVPIVVVIITVVRQPNTPAGPPTAVAV